MFTRMGVNTRPEIQGTDTRRRGFHSDDVHRSTQEGNIPGLPFLQVLINF